MRRSCSSRRKSSVIEDLDGNCPTVQDLGHYANRAIRSGEEVVPIGLVLRFVVFRAGHHDVPVPHLRRINHSATWPIPTPFGYDFQHTPAPYNPSLVHMTRTLAAQVAVWTALAAGMSILTKVLLVGACLERST